MTARLREHASDVTQTASYRSFHARSRAYVLHTLEARAGAAPAPAPEQRGGVVRRIDSFLYRHRRFTLATPVVAAAAAAAIFFFGAPASAPSEAEPKAAVASNQTAGTADVELARIQYTLATIANRSASGQTVDATLLRTVTETTSAVANRIETAPKTMSREHIENYQRTLVTGNYVLGNAQPAAGSENALAAAQRATQDGNVTASRYLGADETPTTAVATSKAPDATAAATSATATPGATATATPGPAATGTATPSASVTPSATPTASASPASTAAPSTPTATPASATATPSASSTPDGAESVKP